MIQIDNIDEKVKELLSKMTLEEKVLLSSGLDFWQSPNVDRVGLPSMYFSDGPHGLRRQAAAADNLGLNESIKSTCFPTAVTMASGWDTETAHNVGVALGKEAVGLDVGVLLGPGTNIKRSPLCGRNFEYFSEDPYLSGKIATAMIKGIQENAASACIKHFAANSQETGRMYIDSIIDERALREIYLEPFEMAIKEGDVRSIMSSYNRLNGEYTNENKHLLVDILRNEWNFDGVIVTDWGGCNSRVEGYKCTNEIEMPTGAGESCDEILAAIKAGEISEELVDENAGRLIKLVLNAKYAIDNKVAFDYDEHHKIAEKASAGSICLLKNDGSLPLNKNEKVCFIGDFAKTPRYQGGGSSCVNPTKLDTIESIAQNESGLNYVGWARGFDQYGKTDKKLIKEAVELANISDKVVVFIGLDDYTESEGKDRVNLNLPQNQIDLLNALKQTGKTIVGVLSVGSPIETHFDKDLSAVLCVYLTGQAGARAILDTLVGKVSPSGKLPETFPVNHADTPAYNYYLTTNELTSECRESIYVGYRYYDKANIAPKYAFGHGLSYTTFEYSNLKITKEGVTLSIKNTGKYDGAEVVQLYIGAKNSKIYRAVRELKGFKKVFVKVGESVNVTIPFDEYSFRYYNVKHMAWEIEDCTYTIDVGSSSRDLRLSGEIKVDGTPCDTDLTSDVLPSYYSGDIKNVDDNEYKILLGREIPEGNLTFVKKNRIIVGYNTSVMQLKYAKGWTGRFFAWAIRFGESFLIKIGKRQLANVLRIGVYHMPMRGFCKMTGGMLSMGEVDGLIIMFNGKFFKGLSHYLKAGKIKKQRAKERKQATENKA